MNKVTMQKFDSRDEWLKFRAGFIGGSDSSCVLDKNPFKSKEQFELEFKNKEYLPKEDTEAMAYGRDAEELIRRLWELENKKKYTMLYFENSTLTNSDYPFAIYSADGIISEKNSERKGLWECKTTFAKNKDELDRWEGQIPNNYYIQLLHGLMVSEFDFAILTVKIKYYDKSIKQNIHIIKDYHIERSDVKEDIEYLKNEEISFVEKNLNKDE